MTGVNGIDGDGDVYRPENIEAFRQYVLSQTNGQGVHFMMADGVITHLINFNNYILVYDFKDLSNFDKF